MNKDIIFTIVAVVVIFLMLVIFIITFFLINKRKKEGLHIEKLQLVDFHQKALLQTQIEIQEQTLKTISQEIHDNIGQVLSLAKLNLNTLEFGEEQKLTDTKNLVSKAINDLRDLSRSMHGDKIAELGLQQAVGNELTILQNSGQYKTNLKITGEPYKLEPQKEMVLFRIIQEAMNNAIKHAKAKHLIVTINYNPEIFNLTIADDGIGFNTADLQNNKTGIGLKSMQNRAALIGGVFSIQSSAGNGTKINIEVKK